MNRKHITFSIGPERVNEWNAMKEAHLPVKISDAALATAIIESKIDEWDAHRLGKYLAERKRQSTKGAKS